MGDYYATFPTDPEISRRNRHHAVLKSQADSREATEEVNETLQRLVALHVANEVREAEMLRWTKISALAATLAAILALVALAVALA